MSLKSSIRNALSWAGAPYGSRLPRVAFIHVPKCGGTSVGNAIATKYPRYDASKLDWRAATAARALIAMEVMKGTQQKDASQHMQFLLSYHLNTRARFISGHYPLNGAILQQHSRQFHFITVLRDPVDRWKSNYIWNKQLPDPEGTNLPSSRFDGTIEDEFAAVISSGMGELMGSVATNIFAGGLLTDDRVKSISLSKTAVENLRQFSIIGILENLPQFADEVSRLIGKRIKIRTENTTLSRYQGEQQETYEALTSFLNRNDVNAVIEKQCEADQIIYDFARDNK